MKYFLFLSFFLMSYFGAADCSATYASTPPFSKVFTIPLKEGICAKKLPSFAFTRPSHFSILLFTRSIECKQLESGDTEVSILLKDVSEKGKEKDLGGVKTTVRNFSNFYLEHTTEDGNKFILLCN